MNRNLKGRSYPVDAGHNIHLEAQPGCFPKDYGKMRKPRLTAPALTILAQKGELYCTGSPLASYPPIHGSVPLSGDLLRVTTIGCEVCNYPDTAGTLFAATYHPSISLIRGSTEWRAPVMPVTQSYLRRKPSGRSQYNPRSPFAAIGPGKRVYR